MDSDILIHLGLPKTGTTAIQRTLQSGAKQLAQAGLFYPRPHTLDDPKHQFLVTGLLAGQHEALKERLAECPPSLMPIFSAEGLSNHLFDFSADSLAGFRACLAGRRVKGVLVTRPWQPWLKSYFKQCIINPPNRQFSHYGFSGDIQAFEQHERVRPFASLDGLMAAIEQGLGISSVDVMAYSPAIVPDFLTYLGMAPDAIAPVSEANSSLSDVAAECVRQINGLVHNGPSRRLWLRHIARLDNSSSTVAHTVKPGDDKAKLDRAVLDQLSWVPESGLTVDRGAFEFFRAGLSEAIGGRSSAPGH